MPDAGRLDVAFAELWPEMNAPQQLSPPLRIDIMRPAERIDSGQPVTFIGKASGRVPAYIGGCTIWHAIQFGDGKRCFGQLFEITSPLGRRGSLAKQGDSGAWILDRNVNLNSWVGMLIAAVPNGDRAYCCTAEDILNASRGVTPPGLVIVK